VDVVPDRTPSGWVNDVDREPMLHPLAAAIAIAMSTYRQERIRILRGYPL
jgi:hypothetical protein